MEGREKTEPVFRNFFPPLVGKGSDKDGLIAKPGS